MAAVDWNSIAPHDFERLVGSLLSDLYQARRTDGAGGDGGIDIHIKDANGLHVFECKSFTGRLGREGGRRRQVERSLKRAALHAPATWTLIVPIDPTPGEETWFEGIGAQVRFKLEWLGLTWLDTQIAQRPWLRRYFVDNGADRAVELLRQLGSDPV